MRSKERRLAALEDTLRKEKKKLDTVRAIKQELDLKSHEIKLTEEQISNNSSSSVGCPTGI
jgi:structural maintenance of chromosome 2